MHVTYGSLLGYVINTGKMGWLNLHRILKNGDQLFKSLNMFRIPGVDDLPARVRIYESTVDIVFLENKTGEITLKVYLIPVT